MTRFARAVLIVSACGFAATAAVAQSEKAFQQRHRDLVTMAAIFGELHHIRRTCEPRTEADIWRNRMIRLVKLEEPQASVHDDMVAAFNKAYYAAQNAHPNCDDRARRAAANSAARGDDIVARLTAPLYETMEAEEGLPQVWRGTDQLRATEAADVPAIRDGAGVN